MKWFKMRSSISGNVKAQSLEAPVFKTWINMLAIYAGNEGFPSLKQMAYETRQTLEVLTSHVEILIADELIDRDSNGTLTPHDWDKHNAYDLSTERVHKYRAAKRAKRNVTVTKRGVTVSLVSVDKNENNAHNSDFYLNGVVSAVASDGISEVVGNEADNQVKQLHHQVKQVKRSRIEENRREEIRKEENTLSHLSSLSPAVVSHAEPQNGASALLNSSQNGKAHEPSEPELDAFSIWAHAVYQRHPKQKNLHDTLWTLKQKFANRPDDQKLLDENHPLWIAYWQLDPSYPRFVPGLADRDGRGWLNDQVWRKPPPPPPDTRTKNQIANDAVYQKFMAEAERKEKSKEKAQ